MAVELCESGKKIQEVSEELGISTDLVRRWRREYTESYQGSFSGKGKANLTPEQQEIVNLKKALKEAQQESEILKKAVSIFSKNDGKYSGL